MLMLVKEIMRAPVISISPEAGLDRALVMLRTQHIRHLPVVENGELVGILSSRDLRKSMVEMESGPDGAPKGLYLPALTKVRSVMHRAVITISPQDEVRSAAQLMSEMKIGCLPVVEPGAKKVVAIVTETDMLKLLARILNQQK
jgi:acetoin utilization protein AcuB